ncbi:MAG: hypothetical protein AAGA90_09945 [Actinomycetota bacterium]
MQTAAVFAHQGGWDEILMVAGPVLVFGYLLRVARKRAIALADEEAAAEALAAEEAAAEASATED